MPAARRQVPLHHGTATLAAALEGAGLGPDRANRLEQMEYTIIQVRAGSPFRAPGTPRPEVMFLRSGLLSKYKLASDNTRQIVALRFPGEAILPRLGPAPYGLQALVKSEIIVADGQEFINIASADPVLMKIMWGIVQRNESIAFEWLVNCGRRSATARVVHLLLETAARSRVNLAARPLKIPFTQKQIAQITGQTAVNVNRVFADLQRLSLVERKGRVMKFKRLRELERIADFDPNYLAFPIA